MPSSVSGIASGRASCCKLPGDTLLPASAAWVPLPKEGRSTVSVASRCSSGSISTPTGRPMQRKARRMVVPFAKRMPPPCPNQGLPDSYPAAVHPKQVSCGDFCRRWAGIGRIKDMACFCRIAFPCKLYQFCIGKFFIEFFLRAAAQPQSGNVHGNAQVLHRPPKREPSMPFPSGIASSQRGIGPVKLMLQCFGGSISVLLTYSILFSP